MKKARVGLLSLVATLVLFALVLPAGLMAQEGKFVEYSYYKKAMETKDPVEKERMFTEFSQKFPESEYYPHMVYECRKYLVALIQAKQFDKVADLIGKLGEKMQNDCQMELAQSYYVKEDFAKYLEVTEKIYAAKAVPELAMYMALAAFRGNNQAAYDKYVAELSKPESLKLLIDLNYTIFDMCKQKNDPIKAEEFSLKVVAAFETAGFPASIDKPAGFPANADWNQYLNQVLSPCLGYAGYAHYKADKYDSAVDLFTKEIRVQPKDAAAYYYIGLIYNKQGKMDQVGPFFAKAAVLNMPNVSDKAKTFLRKLFNNEEAKIQDALNKAKTDLGI